MGARAEQRGREPQPWPDAETLFESVPDEEALRETFTTSYQRDAFGRTVTERRTDGRLLFTTYDHTGGAIATRTTRESVG